MGALLGPLLVLGWLTAAWRLARGPGRVEQALVGALWLGLLWHHVVLALGLFTPWVGGLTAAAFLTAGWTSWRELGAQLPSAWRWLQARPLPLRLWLAAWSSVGVLSVGRLLPFIPSGWDLQAYHLAHAGRWVREASVVRDASPSLWSFYEFFPMGSDAPYAWLMLGDGDTTALFWLPLATLALAPVLLVRAARRLDATDDGALLATLTGLSVPALLSWVHTVYVDGLVALLGVALFSLTVDALRRDEPRSLVAVGAAIGALVATKPWGLALGLVPPALALAHRRRWWRPLLLAGAPTLLGGFGLVERFVATGNPLYPGGLPLGLAEANPVMVAVHASMMEYWAAAGVWSGLILPLLAVWTPGYQGFAPVGLLVLFLLPVALARRERPGAGLVAGGLLWVPFAYMLIDPVGRGLVLGWPNTFPRLYLVPWLVVVLLVAPALRTRLLSLLLGVMGGLTLLGAAVGTVVLDQPAVLAAVGIAAVLLPVGAAAVRWPRALPALAVGGVVALQALASTSRSTVDTTERCWNETYRTNYPPTLGSLQRHDMVPCLDEALWSPLRDAPPATVALYEEQDITAVGLFRGLYRGRWSQHRLTWVSPYAVEPRPGPEAAALHPGDPLTTPEVWIERLDREGVDYVVVDVAADDLPVQRWLDEHPERFERVAEDLDGVLYRVR